MLLSKFIANTKNINAKFAKYPFNKLSFFNFSIGKVFPIKLHDLGEGTKEAMIKKWYKNVGETVEEVIMSLIKLLYRKKIW
jgi:hypothetical protein